MNAIYLDNNATTRIREEVIEVMTACYRDGYYNPASQHQPGRRARCVLEDAREQIAEMLGASSTQPRQDRVIFTSGGTEANNLALHGLVSQVGNIVISSIEHPSVWEPAHRLRSLGYELRFLPVSQSGHVAVDSLPTYIDQQTRLVCVMYANNEIGTLQPMQAIVTHCQPIGVPVHCDAVQAVGKLPLNFRQIGVTSLSFSAHKFHGPRGIGGLLLRHDASLRPFLLGGTQQLGSRPGTEPIAPVVGMAKALELISGQHAPTWSEHLRPLRDHFERSLIQRCQATVVGDEPRMPHTTNLAFPGLDRQALMMAFDLAGIACSTGSACASGSSEPSHVLLATGLDPALVASSVRFSLGMDLEVADIDQAIDRISSVVNNLRSVL